MSSSEDRIVPQRPAPGPLALHRLGWLAPAAAAVLTALYILPLGWFGLNKPDEGRYAEIAREMLVLGDWVTPHLNFVEYFEKPPLVYWVTAVAEAILGPTEFAVRLFPACCGLLTVWMTFALARAMFGASTALLAAVILATAPLFFVLSQVIILDMPLTCTVTASLVCFWFAYRAAGNPAWWYRGMYAAVALGTLIKGPIAIVLSGLTVVTFLALRRDWNAVVRSLRLDGVLIAAAIALPWFVAVSIRHPEFLDFFFMDQHWRRYLSTGEHHGAWWYYLPIVLGGMAPWTVVALGDPKSWRPREWWPLSPAHQFCLAWAVSVFLFFSFSISKIGTYVLPMFPPAAIGLALVIRRQEVAGRPLGVRAAAWVCGALGAGCLVASPVVLAVWSDPRASTLASRLALGGVVLATGSGLVLRRAAFERGVWVLAGAMVLLLGVVISGRDVATQYRPLARAVAATAGPNDLIVAYAQYLPCFSFYTRRRVVNVISWGELEFGRQHGDHAEFFWPEDEQLVEAWRGPRRILLIINRDQLDRLRPSLVPPPLEIASQYKKVVVTNRSPAG